MTPATWLARSARLAPERPALLLGEEVRTDYTGFARVAASIGAALREVHGIAPGDRVALLLPNHIDYLPAMYGAWIAGAAVVPINAKLHPREAAFILEDSGTRLAFVTATTGDPLAALIPGVTLIDVDSPDFIAMTAHDPLSHAHSSGLHDLAWLFYTSGTTGRPKGVQITNGNLVSMALCYFADTDDVLPDDATLYAAPMSHGAGIYNFMYVMRAARHVVPLSGGFDSAEILDLAPRLGSVQMFAAPTMVNRLVGEAKRSGLTGKGIRTIVYAGGPMYLADIIEAVEVLGPRFVQVYGQGECPMGITALPRTRVTDRSHPRWRERLCSVGTAQSAVEVRISGKEAEELPPGEIGEIVVRGATVMKGYWNNPQATADALSAGWLRTGDMGSKDEDGFVTLHDRSKDMIISGGSNVYPREIEEVLLTHPDVAEAAVIGRSHPDWGEEVVASVSLRPGADPDPGALDRLCLARIARFKRPREYRFPPALPKNNYGKILKTELRTDWEKPENTS